MYEVSRTTSKSEMMQGAPFGGGFTKVQAEEASEMVVTGTSFEDPGPDRCEYKLVRVDGSVIAVNSTLGY
jgi:hypothetical protein